MASSSSEEKDKESASESESSDELTDQTNVSDSDSETENEESYSVSEPEPEPEPEPAAKKKSTLPEDSTVKSKPSDDDKAKRKMAENEEVPTKKPNLFQRTLFSETEDITLLQGILDFTSKRDWELNEYYAYFKNLCTFDFTKEQLESKIQRLRKWFVEKEEAVLSRDIDKKCFELSIKIWGDKGVFPRKNRGTERHVDATVDTSLPGGSMTSFFKQENAFAFGLDESTLMRGWDMVEDGPKKREMEAKAKKLLEMEKLLRVKKIGLVNNCAKLIFKD